MKKNDFILIICIGIISLLSFFCLELFMDEGSSVVISVNGEEFGVYNLDTNQVININNTNVLEIIDGEAYMCEANCPDELCIYQGAIHKNGESIICLPNKIIVEVISNEESEFDAISQ